ncbi:MAG: hypothetical protein JSR56_00770 [Proteobacteria bacterium]|nr:hypothetical protein [Pseudomonadota bacterium]
MAAASSMVLREGLPYGAVMATAGASALASRCGLQVLATPLLVLAVLQALWLPLAGSWRHRREWRAVCRACYAIGPAHEHSGIHTVPLGLAVIAGGLATLVASGDGPWSRVLALVFLAATWLLTVVCVVRFVWSLACRSMPLHRVDGAWFLVPAALLGAGIAASAVARLESGHAASLLATLALATVLCGWLGYWAVAGVALVRIRRFGLGGVAQAPWWIAMGCAGLAAAALGLVLQAPVADGWLQAWLKGALAVTVVVAIVLCVPVLIGSARFLLHRCRYCGFAAWPPTFSTAVFALGCLEAGVVLKSPVLHWLGLGAGYATLVLWAVTFAWNTRCTCVSRFGHR